MYKIPPGGGEGVYSQLKAYYVVFLLVTICFRNTQLNPIQNMALQIYGNFVFLHYLTKIRINCVMTNKMVRNERFSPVKHIHLFQKEFCNDVVC